MCFALIFIDTSGKRYTVSFTQRQRQLPMMGASESEHMTWGRNQYENGNLPIGGWCRQDLLAQGAFDHWQPQFVRLPVKGFAIHNMLARLHWFEVSPGEYLQGVILTEAGERRLYLVIMQTQRLDNWFWQWPIIERGG